jgi:peptidyl-tRNA hydrolase
MPKKKEDVTEWVLSKFSPEELPRVHVMIDKAVKCIEVLVVNGPDQAMEYCNRSG